MKKVGADRESREWREYTFFLNKRISDGITNIIIHNLEVLYEFVDLEEIKREKQVEPPLLNIEIKIDNSDLRLNIEFGAFNSEKDSILASTTSGSRSSSRSPPSWTARTRS